ncbi:MAG: transposase, partial [Candidatus Sumerlaeota bacterium]|nr:transposase [Candidatus Sumerlaeota bacterium]
MNPVRAGMCARAEDWTWSSAKAHAQGAKDELLSPKRPFPAPERVGDWSAWLMQGLSEEELNRI